VPAANSSILSQQSLSKHAIPLEHVSSNRAIFLPWQIEHMGMTSNGFWSLGPYGFHRIAYTDWGNPNNGHVLVCVHGLMRNSRDFDFLAHGLERDFRVVCMDVVGRGRSDWLPQNREYGFQLYQSDAAALIARVTGPRATSRLSALLPARHREEGRPWVDWLGTSMGGLIGMLLAAQPNSPIRRLVLNDVGPLVPWSALMRLKGVLGRQTHFASLEELEAALREACSEWGQLTDEQWRHMAEHSARQLEGGGYGLAADPGIAHLGPLELSSGTRSGNQTLRGVDLWSVWDAIRCPVLVLRGKASDVLLPDTAQQMLTRGPTTRVVEFEGIGHAPSLMTADQIDLVRDFLLAS